MNNMDINQMMSILSKMDKKDLEKGFQAASQILKSNDKDAIINNMKNKMNENS